MTSTLAPRDPSTSGKTPVECSGGRGPYADINLRLSGVYEGRLPTEEQWEFLRQRQWSLAPSRPSPSSRIGWNAHHPWLWKPEMNGNADPLRISMYFAFSGKNNHEFIWGFPG